MQPINKYMQGLSNLSLICRNSSAGGAGDAVPLPEREVSSHNPLLFPGPPQAARERDLNSYNMSKINTLERI